MIPKSVKRFSEDIMLYLFDLEADSVFRPLRPEIIRIAQNKMRTAQKRVVPRDRRGTAKNEVTSAGGRRR